MPAKVKGVKKKKAKIDVLPKGPEVEHVLIDVSNAEWKSMRLTLPLTTEARIATIVVALQKFHHVGIKGLRLHLGESVDGTLIDTGANPTLKELGIRGSSQLFDKARASITDLRSLCETNFDAVAQRCGPPPKFHAMKQTY